MIYLQPWREFAEAVEAHIEATNTGHYAGSVQPMQLIEAIVGDRAALANCIKYISRFPETKDVRDLLKTAHYLSRMYALTKPRPEPGGWTKVERIPDDGK